MRNINFKNEGIYNDRISSSNRGAGRQLGMAFGNQAVIVKTIESAHANQKWAAVNAITHRVTCNRTMPIFAVLIALILVFVNQQVGVSEKMFEVMYQVM